MEKQNNIPKLRFPEFSDGWEVKKLKEVADINPSNKSLPEKFVYIDLESVSNGELLKENEIVKEEAPSRAQRVLKENDVLFQMVRPYQMNNLFFNKSGNYVASTGYAQIRTLQYPKYIFQYLHFQKFVDKVIERCTGTSYPAINSTDLSNIIVSFPTLPEQQKIATFLSTIDEKLQALKKKKNLLETYKKGVMQKLFSQQIRFKDDEGNDFKDWEMKKLGETLTIGSGKDYKHLKTGEVPVFGTGGYMTSVNSFLYDGETVCIGRKGTIDKPMYYHGKIWTVDTLFYTHSFVNTLPKFIFYVFETINWKEYNEASGVPSLSKSTIEKIELNIPTLPEQNKIANFLTAIDEKITKVDAQIKQTELWKKGLLQQMFV
jgi:type I restriction enzyme, S subunit